MKIDGYIRHLELQKNELKKKCNNLQIASDITFFEKGYVYSLKKQIDPNFDKITEIRKKIKEANNKLEFLKSLREAIVNNEMQNKKR